MSPPKENTSPQKRFEVIAYDSTGRVKARHTLTAGDIKERRLEASKYVQTLADNESLSYVIREIK